MFFMLGSHVKPQINAAAKKKNVNNGEIKKKWTGCCGSSGLSWNER